MNEFGLEIFEPTSDYAELRLSGGPQLHTRGLNRKAIDDLIDVVERAYSQDSPGQRMIDSVQLRELGRALFDFLDGDERWLSDVGLDARATVLRIAGGQRRLRHLPWELIAADGAYLAVRPNAPFLPVRAVGPITAASSGPAAGNRPLRVLFMASSPEGVEPVLNYEGEEADVLAATAETGTELVVEESGTLEGLRFTVESYGEGYFDVLHLSGHATIHEGQPQFLLENELGAPALVTAEQIAQAMAGRWPRMVFVSGCLTGNAPDGGSIPSMSESLVKAGAPVVLGWALPVGDVSATVFAAHLYRALAAGHPIDHSVITARQQLRRANSPAWHLLRVYAGAGPLSAMVTALHTPGRERITIRHAAAEFLDPQTQISRVASRADFVGRRRVIQRCLRTLKRPLGSEGAAHALVLNGMGGLGKSTLASRLLERMPTHQRVVWYGRVDLIKLRDAIAKIDYPSMHQQIEATELLAEDTVDLTVRLRYLLNGPLARTPCLFVFDDFEDGNLQERAGGYVLSNEMAQILPALLTAIRDSNSLSRVIITSRYQFPPPSGAIVQVEALETLSDIEQTKKIANLANLRPESTTPVPIRDRAIEAAAGNPRLLDWLDKIIVDPALDVDALLSAIENETDRFLKEDVFAQELLDSQPPEVRTMLAKINVVELPIPAATVYAIHEHPDVATHITRATQLGLLEEGTDPDTNQPRYFVSNVLRPLIRPLITDDEYTQACAAAAQSLYDIWVLPPTPTPQP